MGPRWLLDPIILFDTFIVWVPGVIAVWVVQPLVQHDATDFLKVLRTVRMLRLLRIVLFFQHFKPFQDIFQLVRGLLSSGGTLFSALGLIAFTLYVFAIIAIDLIGHQDFTGASDEVLEAQGLFQGIFPTMLTLIRFMHADDAQPILDLLTQKLPSIWIFLWLFTAMSAFVLLNLVTAIIVQQALEMAHGDETEQAMKLQKQRERDFNCLQDAIPQERRSNLTNAATSSSYALGIFVNNWAAGYLTSAVVQIIIQEVLGLHARVSGIGYSTVDAFYALAGCEHPTATGDDRRCDVNLVTSHHINVEGWTESYQPTWDRVQTGYAPVAPQNLGNMGYFGKTSMYLSSKVVQTAWEAEGLNLEFYKGR
eukprot:symbB.v1.2.028792.t1/scaffold3000.1/size65615/2